MNLLERCHNLSWKYKKYIAIGLCIVIVMSGIFIPVSGTESVSNTINRSETLSLSNGDAVKSDSVSLDLQSAKISEENQNSVSQGTKISGGETVRNLVSEIAAAPQLYSAVFEDHGEAPDRTEQTTLFQYPVELGYPVDQNYDGKQTEPNEDLLKMTFKTTPAEEKDTSEEESNDSAEDAPEEKTNDGASKEAEQKRLKEFRDSIYKEVLPTEPVKKEQSLNAGDVKIEKPVKTASQKEENTEENIEQKEDETDILDDADALEADGSDNDQIETDTEKTDEANETDDSASEAAVSTQKQDDEENVEKVTINAGKYMVRGLMRSGRSAFVGDVHIFPSGENGFDRVRLGKDGEFKKSVTIKQDTAPKEVKLYFTNGEEIVSTTFFYAKDTVDPVMIVKEEGYSEMASSYGTIYCANSNHIEFLVEDGDAGESAGMDKATLVYGDKIGFIINHFNEPQYPLPADFYGRVLYNCTDQAGNTSKLMSQYYLIEDTAPLIQISESETCTAPYTLAVKVSDTGSIISGIDKITYTVNGVSYEPQDVICAEAVKLADDLEVPSKAGFSIPFSEVGSYDIDICVTDHCGNETQLHKTVDVTEPELVAVYMPEHFMIHIDPQQLTGKEQIFSDNIALENVSNVDVKVTIAQIDLYVNTQTYDGGIIKDGKLYLVCPDTGERILLEKGKNENVYSYHLPQNATGDIANLYFAGTTSEGSEMLWDDSDISMHVKLTFDKWEEKEE